jgi:pSer/pThr/pTyr-binding forkhead associated (FHA) protein
VKRADVPAPAEAEQAAGSATAQDWTGPAIPALICPAGHANPPSEAACRQCGDPLTNDVVIVPRPVLGVLRLSTGDVITLDRGVVMGRDPRADLAGADGEERPHIVKLPSGDGDISRTHLRVTLDGWHVLVTDLKSTNGTLVTLPGRDPEQLRPDEPVPIRPGTVVSLADGIDFRFEVAE